MPTSHRQPKQLDTTVRLTKVVLEDNQRRFYLMRTTPTLFGEWSLNQMPQKPSLAPLESMPF